MKSKSRDRFEPSCSWVKTERELELEREEQARKNLEPVIGRDDLTEENALKFVPYLRQEKPSKMRSL